MQSEVDPKGRIVRVWNGRGIWEDSERHNAVLFFPEAAEKVVKVSLGEHYYDQSCAGCGAKPDASAELQAAYEAHVKEEREREVRAAFFAQLRKEFNEVRKGASIIVVRGRKVPLGTRGECIWVGEGAYGMRVGLRDEAGEVFWTALSNVQREHAPYGWQAFVKARAPWFEGQVAQALGEEA